MEIIGTQMNAVSACGQGYVSAGVDEQSSCQWPVASCQLPCFGCCVDCLVGQLFQFARRQIFLSKLDVLQAGAGGFGYFFEQAATAGGLIPGKRGAVGDVVEHSASA